MQVAAERAGLGIERALVHEELVRLDRLQRDFIGFASHELRTPATVIYGVLETLRSRREGLSNEQIAELEETLYTQSVRMKDLLERLLDLSMLDAGGFKITPRRFHVGERTRELIKAIDPDFESDIRIEISDDLEAVADTQTFERVVTNLLMNALRHGGPLVPATAEQRDRHLRFVVEGPRARNRRSDRVADVYAVHARRALSARRRRRPWAGDSPFVRSRARGRSPARAGAARGSLRVRAARARHGVTMAAPRHVAQSRVAWIDTDAGGRIHFTAAFRWAEAAETALLRSLGLLDDWADYPRRAVEAEYLAVLRFEDEFEIELAAEHVGTSSITYGWEIRSDGEICIRGRHTVVHVDAEGRSAPLSPEARRALAGAS